MRPVSWGSAAEPVTCTEVAASTGDLHKHRSGRSDSSVHRIGFWGVDTHLSGPDMPRLTRWFGRARGSASRVAGDQQGSGPAPCRSWDLRPHAVINVINVITSSSSCLTKCRSPLLVERAVRATQFSAGLSPAAPLMMLGPGAPSAVQPITLQPPDLRQARVRPRVRFAAWCAAQPGSALRGSLPDRLVVPPHRPAPAPALPRAAQPARSLSPLGKQRFTPHQGSGAR